MNNPYFYSTLSGTPSTQITDSTDHPHTGLIKALSQALRGNYAVKTASDFNITFASAGGFTTIAVTAGKVYRDGKLHTVSALSATAMNASYDSGTGAVDISPVSADVYLMLVALDGGGSNDTIVLRGVNSSTNAVPALVDGDVPIALIKVVGGSADDATSTSTRMVQYFTTSKKENTLSVGYDSSGYTETLSIESSSGDTNIIASVADKDINFKGTDGSSAITALKLDMADAGKATFSGAIATTGANLSGLTASRAVVTDGSKNLASSNITAAEINMLDGIGTDTVATQLGTKAVRTGDQTLTGKVVIDKDRASSVTGAEDITTLHVDFDRVTQDSGTGAHNDIGIDLDVTSSSEGTSTAIGMDIDVVGAGGGTQVVKGLTVDVTGGNTNYAALLNGGSVGIGTSTPAAPLHVISTDDGETLRLESTDAGAGLAPDLIFKRTSSSPADGDNLGNIRFLGTNINDAGDSQSKVEHEFADIYARANDVTLNTEDGELYLRTLSGGNQRRRIDLSATAMVVNEDGIDLDFRVEGDSDAELFVCDAGQDKVGVGVTPTAAHTAKLSLEGSMMIKERSAATADLATYGQLWVKDTVPNQLYFTSDAGNDIRLDEEVFIVSLSDEATNLTAAAAKASFNMPFAMTLTAVKATVNTAPVGSTIIVDINEAGSTILTTKLSIDASELTSTSAATAAVIGGAGPALADDALITFDIDQIGSSTAGKGLKVTLYGYRT